MNYQLIKAISNCYACSGVSVDEECSQTCANEYLIFKKGMMMINQSEAKCKSNCLLDEKCLKQCAQKYQDNEKSLTNFIKRQQQY